MERKKKGLGLRPKIVIMIIGAAALITLATVLVGRESYRKDLTAHYNDMAYKVADVVAGYFDLDKLEEYSDLTLRLHHGEASRQDFVDVMSSEEYKDVLELQNKIRRSMNANGIYVCAFDEEELKKYTVEELESFTDEEMHNGKWAPLCYITDSYYLEDQHMRFGQSSAVAPDLVEDIYTVWTTGERVDNYFIADGAFGYNTTAYLPVTKDGKTVAVVGVEIPMETLKQDQDAFTIRILQIAAIVVIVLLVIILTLLVRMVVKPIELIASEAAQFVENNTVISEKLGQIHTGDEIQVLSETLLQMEQDVNTYIQDIQTVTAEKERIGAELNVATQIQADMLPGIFPAFPGHFEFEVYATMDPAKEVGGDFYDYFLIDDNHLGLVMADVSGKGVPAALFMVIAKTLIKNRLQMGDSPGTALANVNDQLCEGNQAELFVTVWLAVLDIKTGDGVAANAGHEHPAIRRKGGLYELVIYRHSPAVAAMEGMHFGEHPFKLSPGDSLFVYTDGVPEATNDRDELFGTDRMLAALNQDPEAPPAKALKHVKRALDAFVKDAPQFDDITMLGFTYFGGEAEADDAEK